MLFPRSMLLTSHFTEVLLVVEAVELLLLPVQVLPGGSEQDAEVDAARVVLVLCGSQLLQEGIWEEWSHGQVDSSLNWKVEILKWCWFLMCIWYLFIYCFSTYTLTERAVCLVPVHDPAPLLLPAPDHAPPVDGGLEEQVPPPPRVLYIPPSL